MINNVSTRPVLFKLTIPQLTFIYCFFGAFPTLFCVIWSFMYDFEESTKTHCKVYNFLPSVSAAISGFTPQKYVWRICMSLQGSPRVMVAIAYYNIHTSFHVGKYNQIYRIIVAVTSLLNIMEIFALLGLSYISSEENYVIHEKCFVLFMACSLIYMLLTCLIMSYSRTRNGRQLTLQEKKSLNYKIYIFMFDISFFILALYFFYRHNAYCEPTAYSFFGLCEVCVILCNVIYHLTAVLDFKSQILVIQQFGKIHEHSNDKIS